MRHVDKIIAIITLAGAAQTAAAYEPADTTMSIVDAIMGGNGTVVIIQPETLTQRLQRDAQIKTNYTPRKDKRAEPNIRYRVQVYSDNNREKAKANAEYRKRMIEQRMPGTHAYVTYDAPYWRVRVGNYQTEAEAAAAMKQIKSQFPAFSGEVRVVKVRVSN